MKLSASSLPQAWTSKIERLVRLAKLQCASTVLTRKSDYGLWPLRSRQTLAPLRPTREAPTRALATFAISRVTWPATVDLDLGLLMQRSMLQAGPQVSL